MSKFGVALVVKVLGKMFSTKFRPYHQKGEEFVDSFLIYLKNKKEKDWR